MSKQSHTTNSSDALTTIVVAVTNRISGGEKKARVSSSRNSLPMKILHFNASPAVYSIQFRTGLNPAQKTDEINADRAFNPDNPRSVSATIFIKDVRL